MAKNIRTSGNYSIRAGTGSTGDKTLNLAAQLIDLDSVSVKIRGNLDIEGTQTVIDTATLSIEDNIITLNRNDSGQDVDAGILVNRGAAANAALFYWNEGEDVWKAVTSASQSATSVTDTALAKISAATPTADDHVATKGYVATQIGGITIAGDDSTVVTVATATNVLRFAGTNGITTAAAEPDTLTISLGRNLDNIDTISTDRSNQDLTLTANGTGAVVINDVLSFSGMASDPTATAQTKIYNKTAGGGGTGLYFRNSNIGSGAVGELISKSKATALAIALG